MILPLPDPDNAGEGKSDFVVWGTSTQYQAMRILFNGQNTNVDATQLNEILSELQFTDTKGLAVAVNLKVIPKENWITTTLNENDQLVVITATQGG